MRRTSRVHSWRSWPKFLYNSSREKNSTARDREPYLEEPHLLILANRTTDLHGMQSTAIIRCLNDIDQGMCA